MLLHNLEGKMAIQIIYPHCINCVNVCVLTTTSFNCIELSRDMVNSVNFWYHNSQLTPFNTNYIYLTNNE